MLNDKTKIFKVKLAGVIFVLVLGVASFIAANGINEMQVEDAGSGNISVEFKDADIHDVFRVLALKGNVSIVSDPEVKGLVTVQITDIPWEKALDVICRTYAYAYEREGNIIRVTTLDKQGQENLVTDVFPLNYAKAANVALAIAEMRSDRGKIKADDRANLLIVTDIPTNIYKIAQVVKRLDSMTPQVSIEAKIVETNMGNTEDLGIKWNASYGVSMSSRPTTFPWPANSVGDKYKNYLPAGDDATTFPSTTVPTFPLVSSTSTAFSYGILDGSAFNVLLQAIQTQGKTKILSNPRITTLDNEPAEIHVGTDWPIANYAYNEQTDRFVISGWEYKSYGILLKVTPTINQNGYVTLKLHPEISDKTSEVDFQGATVPVLSTQSTDCTVMIKDGNTLVIGGLIKDKVVTTRTKVPFLGDIPILGIFFSHKSEEVTKNDLLIFITPHVVKEDNIIKQQQITNALDVQTSANPDGKVVEMNAKDKVKSDSFIQGETYVEPQQPMSGSESVNPAASMNKEGVIDESEFNPDAVGNSAVMPQTKQPAPVQQTKTQTQANTAVMPKSVKEKAVQTQTEQKDNNKGFLLKK